MKNLTPMMQQYVEIKERYKDCILFFRLGDFYEMFFDDAITASRELEITLTERGVGLDEKAPMCGVPHHVSDNYIAKLVEKGYKVAICEQVEDPAEAKGLVKRDVIRVVTPGTISDQNVIKDKVNNYLASIVLDGNFLGLSYMDNSTGEMFSTNYQADQGQLLSFAINELGKILPSEIICNEEFYREEKTIKVIKNNINPYFNVFPDEDSLAIDWLGLFEEQFSGVKLAFLKDSKKLYANIAAANLLEYLKNTQKTNLKHISDLEYYEANNYMVLDYSTRMNLEIHETIISKDKKGSILGFIDETSTSMGGRLLRKWIEQPLINKGEIEGRSSVVEYFFENLRARDEAIAILKNIYDIERLATKISKASSNARDLVALKNSIAKIPALKNLLDESGNPGLKDLNSQLDDLGDIYRLIDKSIIDNPPITITEGNLIKEGYNEQLDDIRNISLKGKNWLSQLEQRERENSGINNLRIGFNKVLGYYFEITKANIKKAPEHFIRKQTLTNSERYYTEELKNMEEKILSAEDNLLNFEYEIFTEIRTSLEAEVDRIQEASKIIATIDVLTNFANIAYSYDFIRPEINQEGLIHIKDGRHPVIESIIDHKLFVPNDTKLDLDKNMVQIITGPNMSGKSTYMRQTAIITLLAHIGSYVPASYANISIVDRIFTRIGAADNLSQGESTFMVEMNEVSNIIKSATRDSLIILDEVGRGTSTYDGLSIAWALIEYIAEDIRAKTLFATHYHELTQLEDKYENIQNLTIAAEEKGEDVIFLRKVIQGSTNKSYGIQVARLAGIDRKIISRANEILYSIEKDPREIREAEGQEKIKQLDLSDYKKNYYIEKISEIDIVNTNPMEAFKILDELIRESREIKGDTSD